MSRKIQVEAEVEVPKVPNFLRMSDGKMLPVSAVSEDSLRKIGRLWIEALIERSIEQRGTDITTGGE